MGGMLLAQGGFNPPTTEEFSPTCLIGSGSACFNRPMLLLLIAAFIVATLFWLGFRNPQRVPGKLQNLMEVLVDFIRKDIVFETIGPEQGARWVPYLTTLFSFVLVGNLFEIAPFVNYPVNFRSAFTWMLAILSLLIFVTVGIRSQGPWGYFKSVAFPPGVPKGALPLLAIIEIVSTFIIRPLTLSVRLFGNMVAGHFLLIIFWLGTVYLLQPSILALFSAASFATSLALVAFEVIVATLQAYIFTILTAVYIAGAIEPAH